MSLESDKHTFLSFGLIGHPLAHSYSPLLHQAALNAAGLAGEYRLYPVPPLPQGENLLLELLGRLRDGSLDGLNVTIPHKQSVLRLVDELTPIAQKVGAANLLYRQSGKLVGDNSDVAGFLQDLKAFLAANSLPNTRRALVLGAGGAARAVVAGLLQERWQVLVTARRPEQAHAMAARLDPNLLEVVELDPTCLAQLKRISLVVNATPIGMYPEVEPSPWPAELPLPPGAAVYDLIYNPGETSLMRAARLAGLPVRGGLGMLVEQAALAFECWTGQVAPRSAMFQAAPRLD
jgi:shikimate dehydrogenase